MRLFIPVCLLVAFSMQIGIAQQKHNKHKIRPGISMSYLPTWVLDAYDGNTKAQVFHTGIHALKEIGSESYFSLGLVYGKYHDEKEEEHSGILLPIRLQKFFVKERKGFNLGFGMWWIYCETCRESINAAFAQEISYMFSFQPIRVNVGLQAMLGALYDDTAIHAGPQVQLIWVPELNGRK